MAIIFGNCILNHFKGADRGQRLEKICATGGWGFAHFNDGKPADEAVLKTCFPCHQAIKDRDFAFTRYAP